MKQKGMFWHVYHNKLLEYCYSYDERVNYIKEHKPANERKTRLRLLKPVKGKLPKAVIEAYTACDKAYAVYNACYKALTTRYKTYITWSKARATLCKAIQDNMSEIEALHKVECPDCPWDGEKIVF